jgi:hypothetical protein
MLINVTTVCKVVFHSLWSFLAEKDIRIRQSLRSHTLCTLCDIQLLKQKPTRLVRWWQRFVYVSLSWKWMFLVLTVAYVAWNSVQRAQIACRFVSKPLLPNLTPMSVIFHPSFKIRAVMFFDRGGGCQLHYKTGIVEHYTCWWCKFYRHL